MTRAEIIRTDDALLLTFCRGAPVENLPVGLGGAVRDMPHPPLFQERQRMNGFNARSQRDPAAHHALRAELAAQVQAYLANGGEVRRVPAGASAFDPASIDCPELRARAIAMQKRRGFKMHPTLRARIMKDRQSLGEILLTSETRAEVCRRAGLNPGAWEQIAARAARAGIALPARLMIGGDDNA